MKPTQYPLRVSTPEMKKRERETEGRRDKMPPQRPSGDSPVTPRLFSLLVLVFPHRRNSIASSHLNHSDECHPHELLFGSQSQHHEALGLLGPSSRSGLASCFCPTLTRQSVCHG
ncbi:uncharacterized protein LDX57_001249 [Aspergillus melleus]|uniref:uncharacterized protein n=1 Tax=Aspergillus melleus TaxID=138277 RepID=UPI001E8D04FF|nr:uncharacterized protein LDX57_001249 [Aspergillus melleus]KAH8423489.1 hypothetical protein LDX57_001249 [Aspergillus melleus]